MHRSFPLAAALLALLAHVEAQTPPPLLARPPELGERPVAVVGDAEVRKFLISGPPPEYPIEARRRHFAGKGVFQLTVSEDTGEVVSVTVLTSTGYPMLDHSATKALKRWKFRPRTLSSVTVPITFSIPPEKPRDHKKT
jgi:protein TonB